MGIGGTGLSDRLEQLEKLHAADPADPFLNYGIALEHYKAQRLEDALAWLDKTLELDSHYCYAYYQKAKLLSDLGDDDTARAVLEAGMASAVEAGDEKARSEMAELLSVLDEM